jgi:cytochrome c-type biogenesis protein CcmF
MKAHLGQFGIWLCLLACVAAMVLLVFEQLRRSRSKSVSRLFDGRWFIPFAVIGAAVAVAAMQWALITHDFSIAYVAANNASVTPLIYSITGMWSALAGSILLWGAILMVLVLSVMWRYRRDREDQVVGWATAILLGVAVFFFALMAGPANPFAATQGAIPSQGAGPNALLQNNPLVVIHPPLLYLGMVGFSVPFAFAIAMLITGRVDERWYVETRRWALLSWTSLSVGLVLGAWWSYQVLGWGGFWGWDPVENAALMPWLLATAYVHSIVVEERRGLLRVWNLSLAISIFAATILGTFFTRSGVVQSVHAFSSSTVGPTLLAFFAFIVLGSLALIAWRADSLRSQVGLDAAFSREGAFVLNNMLLVAFCLVVLAGTVFPLLYEAINGGVVTVGPPYFNAIGAPIGIALLILMALAPLLSWRVAAGSVVIRRLEIPAWIATVVTVVLVIAGVRGVMALCAYFLGTLAAATALRSLILEFIARRRRGESGLRSVLGRSGGGMVVHLGVVIVAIGLVTSTTYLARSEIVLSRGETVVFHGHSLKYLGISTTTSAYKTTTSIDLLIDDHGIFKPGISQFTGRNSDPVGTPAIDSSWKGDLYLTFDAIGAQGRTSGASVASNLKPGSVAIGVIVEPLLPWLWIGGLVIGAGGLLALIPTKRVRRSDNVEDVPHEASLA